MIKEDVFGTLSDGRSVHSYTITNKEGESVTLLDYGATIYQIVTRDRNGNLGDVVLGVPKGENMENYRFMGSTIGRCANRIAYGRCQIDGVEVQLEQNGPGGHFLHGGSGNYATKLFDAKIDEDNQTVVFHHRDHGEGGFDCEVEADVAFSFDDECCLKITYDWTGEKTTILNPTNHTYFNLSGNQDVRSQILEINADKRAGRDGEGLPDGTRIPVADSPADFIRPRTIREAMDSDCMGYFQKDKIQYDEFYTVERAENRFMARLFCPENGRKMEVYSDMPSLVLFVPYVKEDVAGKYDQIYRGYCAVCLETGFVPNAVNCPSFDSPVFKKGETLHSVTIYQFEVD